MHQEVIKNLESIHGALLRMNRSIQAEGTFGIMKNDRWYKRIVRRGIHSVKLEVLLVAIGHNLYKYQKKRWETELPHRFKKEFLWGRGRALSLRMISVIYTQQVQKWRCEKTQSSFFTSPITTMVSSFVAEWYGWSAERHHEWRVMSLEIIRNEISAVQQELLLKLEIKSIAMLEYSPKQDSEACWKQDHQNWRWSCFSDYFTNQMCCSEHGKYCDRAQIGRKSGL